MRRKVIVKATWDSAVRVWVATSDDVPGLVTEAATLDELAVKLPEIIAELLELNSSRFRMPGFMLAPDFGRGYCAANG